MQKIPTLFVRDENDRRYVTDAVTPGCEWVLDGRGTPTRKYDGTCVMFDGEKWWARREVKPGKPKPEGYVESGYDDATGKWVGWEPIEQSPFAKFHAEALEDVDFWSKGTYELVGPKINGNPERFDTHLLIKHGETLLRYDSGPLELIRYCIQEGWEGIVWHHPDGQMAKLKVRDYPKVVDHV